MEQFELNFDAGLTEQVPDFGDVVRATAYSGRKALKIVAADLDLSSSMLSRMLGDDSSVNFPAQRLSELIAATGDLRPVYWLVEKFCADGETRKRQAAATLEALLPRIASALKALEA